MKNLWFKQCYVEPILENKKNDTIRKNSLKLPVEGEEISFSVGPRRPFAFAKITRREYIDITACEQNRRDQLSSIYPGFSGVLVRLEFKLEGTR